MYNVFQDKLSMAASVQTKIQALSWSSKPSIFLRLKITPTGMLIWGYQFKTESNTIFKRSIMGNKRD